MQFVISSDIRSLLTWGLSILATLISIYVVYVRDIKTPMQATRYLNKIQQTQKKIDMASKLLAEYRKLAASGIDDFISDIEAGPSANFVKEFPEIYKEFIENTKNIKFGILSKGIQKTYTALLDGLEGKDIVRSVDLKDDLIREIRQSQHIIESAGKNTGNFSDLFKNLVNTLI